MSRVGPSWHSTTVKEVLVEKNVSGKCAVESVATAIPRVPLIPVIDNVLAMTLRVLWINLNSRANMNSWAVWNTANLLKPFIQPFAGHLRANLFLV